MLGAVAVVLLVANAVVAWTVERRAEESLGDRLGSPVEVELSGWPVTPRLLFGSVPEANVVVEDAGLPGTGLELGRFDLTLRDVSYTGRSEGPLDPPVEARTARFESSFGEGELDRLAASLPGVSGAGLTGGRVSLALPAGLTTGADLLAEDGRLLMRPDTPLLVPEIPLTGELPWGASVEDVRVQDDKVNVRGTARDLGVEE